MLKIELINIVTMTIVSTSLTDDDHPRFCGRWTRVAEYQNTIILC